MKPARAIVERDTKPSKDGVDITSHPTIDPVRTDRVLAILRDILDNRTRSGRR